MQKGLKPRSGGRARVQGALPRVVVVSEPLSVSNRRLLESCLRGLRWKVVEATTWEPGGEDTASAVLVLGQKAHDAVSTVPYRSAEGHRWRSAS
jgi:hypothetical protein